MPTFEYKGKTTSGAPVSGTLEAQSKEELEKFLRKQKIVVTNVKKKRKQIEIYIGSPVKSAEISRFTRQFCVMIGAGLPLVRCLDILGNQTENKKFQEIIHDIRDSVSGGSTLAAAMGKHKKIFDELYINMIDAGEMGGALATILSRLADFREDQEALKRKVKGALIYPAIMTIVLVLVTWIMLTFILPIFAGMFEGLDAELPGPTKVVMSISDFARSKMVHMIVGLVLTIVAYTIANKREKTRYYIDFVKLKLPVFGTLIKKTAVSRFTRTLATLLSSGVNLIDALNITGKTSGNVVVEKTIHQAMIRVSEGETLTEPLDESPVFPSMVVQMISVGEKTGDLDGMLAKIADFYDEEVNAAVEALTSMIEPILIVVMGIVVGGLLVAMYLPMFDIVGSIE